MNNSQYQIYRTILAVALLCISFLFSGCSKDDENDGTYNKVAFVIPPGFPEPLYNFRKNPLTERKFELGRKLFYDRMLSRDNTISCGSCHLQAGAFSHIDHKVSHGIDELNGTRNSPALFNLAWQEDFFWDGGVNHIEVQPIAPIQNPVEMDETLENVMLKLNASQEYKTLFKDAYGSDSITSQMMLRSLAQFMAMLVSANSPYDLYVNGIGKLSPQALNGLRLFRLHCGSCHKEPLFTDNSFRNNGLDTVFADQGRMLITGDPLDEGKFKVPSLRNVAVSFPYMHDGRFKTLDKVLDHYISGVKYSPSLDNSLSGGIPLTPSEKSDIIRFLESLTDSRFLHDKRFSEIN